MPSLFENKRLVLVFAVLALGALMVLATSLSEVPFREGQRFVREEVEQAPAPPSVVEPAFVDVPLWQQLLALILLVLMVVLIGLLLSPEMRKRMFLLLIRGVLTALGITATRLFRSTAKRLRITWQARNQPFPCRCSNRRRSRQHFHI